MSERVEVRPELLRWAITRSGRPRTTTPPFSSARRLDALRGDAYAQAARGVRERDVRSDRLPAPARASEGERPIPDFPDRRSPPTKQPSPTCSTPSTSASSGRSGIGHRANPLLEAVAVRWLGESRRRRHRHGGGHPQTLAMASMPSAKRRPGRTRFAHHRTCGRRRHHGDDQRRRCEHKTERSIRTSFGGSRSSTSWPRSIFINGADHQVGADVHARATSLPTCGSARRGVRVEADRTPKTTPKSGAIGSPPSCSCRWRAGQGIRPRVPQAKEAARLARSKGGTLVILRRMHDAGVSRARSFAKRTKRR